MFVHKKRLAAASSLALLMGALSASAEPVSYDFDAFWPGNLILSRTVYANNPNTVQVGETLPPGCTNTQPGCSASSDARFDGTFPFVWNNAPYDGSFGITSAIYLDQIRPGGGLVSTVQVPDSVGPMGRHNHLVGSFSSKSELALHLSTDLNFITFMGYVAPIDAVDVSNSNTPGAIDLTNPVGENVYRAVAKMDRYGHFEYTETNAYSGNNGRAAIYNELDNVFYTAGNAGNGANPQPNDIILGAGAQLITPSSAREVAQNPGTPTPVASFSITELGQKPDKIGKDDNFRGIALYDNVLYYTKGSGGNGVNTVYFVDTTGKACPNGVGLPSTSATLPITPLAYNTATLQTSGLPNNMCILAGFPTTLAKTTTAFPFALWFANSTTLYVSDEGDGYVGGNDLYSHAATQTTAGLQKWTFDAAAQQWKLAYTLTSGLNLGVPYTVPLYPTGLNATTGLPWAPATDGLRNIIGRVNSDGTVTIWAITSTVSGNGDTGADPNRLVVVTDQLSLTDPALAAEEKFHVLRTAKFAEALRGISFTPGTGQTHAERGENAYGDFGDLGN